MSKRKRDTRKPVQVSGFTHKVLKSISLIKDEPIGRIVDKIIQEKYPLMYEKEGK
jgi:hypothetical protein